jgi:NAD(P)H-hydrate epimerase
MRDLDQTAIKKFGIREELLMENAGEATYFVIRDTIGIKHKKFLVFCGIGNNGGDGFVIARKLHSNHGKVKVFILGDKSRYQGAARLNLDILCRLPIEIQNLETVDSIRMDVTHSDAIVDAIFGTGLIRDIEGRYRDAIELINESGKTVFSADIPSGIAGDTGKVMGVSVKADHTVTFGLPKPGNVLHPGSDHCGKLYVTHISFPPLLYAGDSFNIQISDPPQLPARDKDAHKGSVGQTLFIAGASSYFGAPYFSSLSFLKAGGGYSRLAAPASIIPHIAGKASEVVFIPQKETSEGSIALDNRDALIALSEKMDMVVLGPGLSLSGETGRLVRELVKEVRKPLLIDGDGITAICDDLGAIQGRDAGTILTPHLGEMSRMTGLRIPEIDENKIEILQRCAEELDAVVVLKGSRSLIGCPDKRVYINMSGNPGMATAGSGDVLTGTIAAMFGLGLDTEDAVLKGVFIHGLSADLAADEKGEDGITAQDILDYLPYSLKLDREGLNDETKERYLGGQVI